MGMDNECTQLEYQGADIGHEQSYYLQVKIVNDQVVRLSINGAVVHDAASQPYPQNQYYDISHAPSHGFVGVYVITPGRPVDTDYNVYYEGFKATND